MLQQRIEPELHQEPVDLLRGCGVNSGLLPDVAELRLHCTSVLAPGHSAAGPESTPGTFTRVFHLFHETCRCSTVGLRSIKRLLCLLIDISLSNQRHCECLHMDPVGKYA